MCEPAAANSLESTTLLDLVHEIHAAADLAAACRALASSVRQTLACDGASVMRVRDGHLEVVATAGKPSSLCGLALPIEQVGAALAVLDTRRPVVLPDTAEHPQWKPIPGEEEVRSWLAAPLVSGEQILGILEATAYQVDQFGPSESALIESLAWHAAPALQQAQLLEEARHRLREVSLAPSEAQRTLADLEQALQQIADEAQHQTGAAHAFVFVLEPAGQTLRCAGAAGPRRRYLRDLILSPEGSLGSPRPGSRSVPGWFRKAHPHREQLATLGIQAGPMLPLQANGQVVGFLGVGTDQRAQRVSSAALQLLTYLSSRASLEIERFQPGITDSLDYEAAVRNAPLGICILGASGKILACNPALGDMVGRDPWDLVGQTWKQLLPAGQWQRLQQVLEEVSITDERQDLEIVLYRHHDDRRDIRFSLAPTSAASQGSRVRTTASDNVVAILEDVTAWRILEQERSDHLEALREKNEALQELDGLKSRFVSNVSHELRNPLAVIKLYSALARKGRPEKREYYLQTIERETQRLETLVENVLDLSRIDRGTLELHPKALQVESLIKSVVEVYQAAAQAKGIDLENQVRPPLPALWADQDHLFQILINLVDNAIKFTPAGGRVWIQAGCSDDPQARHLEIRVVDTGPGIPPDEQEKVFERFYRGKSNSPITPGTGLGLAIVREMVELHRGQVHLQSSPGQGSTFRLLFPLVQPSS